MLCSLNFFLVFRSPHDDQDSESDDELPVIVTSENPPDRHISISSRSRTPSVVDLTNDSGLEDEDVIDLTTSFQVSVCVCVCVCMCVCVRAYPLDASLRLNNYMYHYTKIRNLSID